ncbi:GvpL/GvpF family gas vesicle protein [Streptomyces sp. NPDC015131]|uniref:GvpL/GvpF family gas vesicle protein n=1 Tax=Streptomyces sp. NPDC015131 TaxID=3364941 RepID=UPI0037004B5A
MTGGSGEVTYLYAVADDAPALRETVRDLRGVGGAPVRVLSGEGVAAVVSGVPAAEFEERPLAAHLEDLTWLEAVARAHHGVVDAVAARVTVLPLRLATIYRDDAGVGALLDASGAAFRSRLARLAGHVEWGVKLYLDAPPAGGATEDEGGGSGGAPGLSPGRAYLRSRRNERTARDEAHRAAADAARRVDEAALAYAVDHVRHRVQQGPLAGGPAENVGNDAYLVPSGRADAFLAAVREAAGSGSPVRAEITGPWAPYSFAADVPEAGVPGSGGTDREEAAPR